MLPSLFLCFILVWWLHRNLKSLFYLISRSMLHKGDMSSNVLENFTTCDMITKIWINNSFDWVAFIKHNWGWKCEKRTIEKKISPVNRCPPGEVQSSAHTAEVSVLSAWSSWQSSPSRSALQTSHSPPLTKTVAKAKIVVISCAYDPLIKYIG